MVDDGDGEDRQLGFGGGRIDGVEDVLVEPGFGLGGAGGVLAVVVHAGVKAAGGRLRMEKIPGK